MWYFVVSYTSCSAVCVLARKLHIQVGMRSSTALSWAATLCGVAGSQKRNPYEDADPAAIATWANTGIAGELHDETEITPDDYLWQNLPGRCCFSGHWDNHQRDKNGGPKWVSIQDCTQCSIWGQPDASCHRGKSECATCGMDLYCEGRTPPLLGGAKVCTGESRVGEGCNDVYKMGVCMNSDLDDCMAACQQRDDCEMIVYYSLEMKGSVMCTAGYRPM